MLRGCCNCVTFCNDLFADHDIESHCETDEEQRDAVLHHLLDGMCVLRPDVLSCKSLADCLTSTMHLSFNICTLLLSAYKCKQVTLSTLRLCCASIGIKTNGSNDGRDLSVKLQQRLTRWGPLCNCDNAVNMISHIEQFGSGSLLELAVLHGIDLDADTSSKDELRDVIVRHLISGKCQNANAVLCASVCSVLLLSTEPSIPTDLTPLILDAVINLGTKKTLRRVLRCAGISHTSTDSIGVLRSLLGRHRDTFPARQPDMWRDSRFNSKEDSTVLGDIANNWPQRISHVDKTRIVRDFRTATSLNMLKTVACASCAEKVCARDALNNPVADLDLDILRNPSISSGQISMDPPLPYTEGPLTGILVDPTGVHCDEDGTLYLSLCPPCRSALSRRKLPRFALANLNVIGAVPPELESLTLVEELIISRCRAKLCIMKLQDHNDDVDLPTAQRGMKGHIIIFPQHPKNLPDVMPPHISDIIAPICILFCGSTAPTPQWMKEKARPLVVRREVVLKALYWLRTHNPLYHKVVIDMDRISMFPDNNILNYHIESVEVSAAVRTLVSRYDMSDSHLSGPPPDTSAVFESAVITDVDANAPSHQLKAAALWHAKQGGSFVQVPHDSNPVNEFFSRDFMDKNTLTMDKPGYLGTFILSHPSSL